MEGRPGRYAPRRPLFIRVKAVSYLTVARRRWCEKPRAGPFFQRLLPRSCTPAASKILIAGRRGPSNGTEETAMHRPARHPRHLHSWWLPVLCLAIAVPGLALGAPALEYGPEAEARFRT